MEKNGPFNLDLPGRHFNRGQFPPNGKQKFANDAKRLGGCWDGNKSKEICVGTNTTNSTFGFSSRFQERSFASTKREVTGNFQGIGKTFNSCKNVMSKNGGHFGSHQIIFNGNALFKGFLRPVGSVCEPTGNTGVGQKVGNPTRFKRASKGNAFNFAKLERENFSRKNSNKGASFGLIPRGMGWSGHNQWRFNSGILERKEKFAHQCERTGSSNKYSSIIGQNWGTCNPKGGQFSNLFVSHKGWGKDPQFKPTNKAFSKMVHGETNNIGHFPSQKFRGLGRWAKQVENGQGGLHPRQATFLAPFGENEKVHNPPSGHVCLPRQSSVKEICIKVPPLASLGGGCPKMPPKKSKALLCKPPMVSNRQMAKQVDGQQRYNMHDDSTILGFKFMVAPTNQNACKGNPHVSNTPLSGDVQELLGKIYATSQVAPNLHDCVRRSMQGTKVSSEIANSYVNKSKTVQRYDNFSSYCGLIAK
jgi:hypothetical protein